MRSTERVTKMFDWQMRILDSSCCQTDRQTFGVPAGCFERNGCPGLHWIGARACSARMLNAIALEIQGTMRQVLQQQQQPVTRFGFNVIP